MSDFSKGSDSSDSPIKKMNFGKAAKRLEPNWARFEDPGPPVTAGDLEFNDLEIAFDKR